MSIRDTILLLYLMKCTEITEDGVVAEIYLDKEIN